jgi:Fic family protein
MFNPNFSYTTRIVNNLVEIQSIKDFITNSPLILETEVSLKRDALLKSAHHSTAIEGNPLTFNQVETLFKSTIINSQKKAEQEVLNYLKVLENLDNYLEKGKITEESILHIHEAITHYTLDYTYLEGQYRTIPVHIVNSKGETIFIPPHVNSVKGEMRKLVEWMNHEKDLNPVIAAGIIHYEFVRIHPFTDGNGRTGRVLAALYLHLRKFDVDRLFTLDDYYDKNRPSYYTALNTVDHETQDLTEWLDYFLEGFKHSIQEIKDQLLLILPEISEKNIIKLSDKNRKILEHIHLNDRISNSDVQQILNISRQGAYKHLRNLMDMDLIEQMGGSRSTYYVLKKVD